MQDARVPAGGLRGSLEVADVDAPPIFVVAIADLKGAARAF